MGQIVVDQLLAGTLEAVGTLFEGEQGGVADDNGGVGAVKHEIKVGVVGNEGNFRIAPLVEEDAGVGKGGAAGGIGGHRADGGEGLGSAADQEQRAHTVL